MATALPCRLSSPRRTTRAVLSTVAIGVVAIAAPAVAIVLALRALTDGSRMAELAALAVAVGLLLVVVVVSTRRGADRPLRRSSPPVAWFRRTVAGPIEASLLGTGTLAGWTSTRVDGSLADLEQPTRDARPVFRPPPVPPPPMASAVLAPPSSSGRPGPPSSGWTQPARRHVVRHGETWWSLAELYLGDGGRAGVLKQVNAGRPQPDGSVVDHRRPLRAGWTIEVPLAEEGPR